MYTVKTLPEFDAWIDGLKDRVTHLRLKTRLRKATLGNLGVVKPVGENLYEMKEYFGPGWRMYYTKHGETLILMLGGGNKGSQSSDIAKANKLKNSLEE